MGKHESVMMLWQYLELSEKKRLMHEFTRTHGEYFSRREFFEFLEDKYDDSQIAFEVFDGISADEKAAV